MFKEKIGWKETGVLILIAYLFSFVVRLIWVWQFKDRPDFHWNGQLMINTNDGYFFASAVQYLLSGAHADNPRVPLAIQSYPGFVYLSYFFTKYTPFSLETVILYMPAVISSLVVVPLILVGKLIRRPWAGFFAALLGSIAWSYYNRTMVGYYDTDMFSVLLQFTIFYFFLLTIYDKRVRNVLWLAGALILYPFFYPQGLSLIYVMYLLWILYQLVFQYRERSTYLFIILASVALWEVPLWFKVLLVVGGFILLKQGGERIGTRGLVVLAAGAVAVFFVTGDMFTLILSKLSAYLERGVEEKGLHFYQVIQTVREAGKISWETVANRIIGHPVLLAASLIGYILLVLRHRPFVLALPLIGVGVFAHWAGLRFTVYAAPFAAFSLIYLFRELAGLLHDKRAAAILFVTLSLASLVPNILHVIRYKVPTVMSRAEVEDLTRLNRVASSRDYTLAWWDYGYPIWFYADTSTLIDGAKHHDDNFFISKILQTDSPELAANLGRLAVETYVDSNYSTLASALFHNGKKDQKDPNLLLGRLATDTYPLPKKSREIYLYLPYRMMGIFPTVMLFGNLDPKTGKALRKPLFMTTAPVGGQGDLLQLSNGLLLDLKEGYLLEGQKKKIPLKRLAVAVLQKDMKIKTETFSYRPDAQYSAVYLKSYRRVVLMDNQTFRSIYVQMFMLGNYDDRLFEPVVLSPYSRIYRLKR
jgi:undecaprenyl-diphosphooligosaccharide--protein glycosyltransferase